MLQTQEGESFGKDDGRKHCHFQEVHKSENVSTTCGGLTECLQKQSVNMMLVDGLSLKEVPIEVGKQRWRRTVEFELHVLSVSRA